MLEVDSDWGHYLVLADSLLGGAQGQEEGILFRGPGYPAFLAACFLAFGRSVVPVFMLQMVVDSMTCVLVYLIAREVLPGHGIACLLAGLFAAFSLTSASLSVSIMSETMSYALLTFSLLGYLRGMRSGRWFWLPLSGIVSGFSALTRVSGLLWPLILFAVVFVVPASCLRCGRRRAIWGASCFLAAYLVVICLWSLRNYDVDGIFLPSTGAAYTCRYCLIAQTKADSSPGLTLADVRTQWKWLEYRKDETVVKAYEEDVEAISDVSSRYPLITVRNFLGNAFSNDLALGVSFLADIRGVSWVYLRVFPYAAAVTLPLMMLFLGGSVIALMRAPNLGAVVVVVAYFYFVLASGCSFGALGRLVYPSQTSWMIMLSLVAEAAAWRIPGLDRLSGWLSTRLP